MRNSNSNELLNRYWIYFFLTSMNLNKKRMSLMKLKYAKRHKIMNIFKLLRKVENKLMNGKVSQTGSSSLSILCVVVNQWKIAWIMSKIVSPLFLFKVIALPIYLCVQIQKNKLLLKTPAKNQTLETQKHHSLTPSRIKLSICINTDVFFCIFIYI